MSASESWLRLQLTCGHWRLIARVDAHHDFAQIGAAIYCECCPVKRMIVRREWVTDGA